ncbi:MAG: hypothetical protein M1548_04040 [Actinobacteria bacterium]|nr:hypothetical protein [Actinomycetota bacterium]
MNLLKATSHRLHHLFQSQVQEGGLISYLAVSQIGLSFAQTAGLLNIHRSTVPRVLFRDVI